MPTTTPPLPRTWPAYAASACAALYGGVSLYWALGGTAGLRTVGAFAQQLGASGGAGPAALIWATVAAKAVGAVLPLSLVARWGAVVPWRVRAALAGGASVVLLLYGAAEVLGAALVLSGAIVPAGRVDRFALRWHLALWDPWFLLWGVLLGAVTWQAVRARRPGSGSGGHRAGQRGTRPLTGVDGSSK